MEVQNLVVGEHLTRWSLPSSRLSMSILLVIISLFDWSVYLVMVVKSISVGILIMSDSPISSSQLSSNRSDDAIVDMPDSDWIDRHWNSRCSCHHRRRRRRFLIYLSSKSLHRRFSSSRLSCLPDDDKIEWRSSSISTSFLADRHRLLVQIGGFTLNSLREAKGRWTRCHDLSVPVRSLPLHFLFHVK